MPLRPVQLGHAIAEERLCMIGIAGSTLTAVSLLLYV
jgi:hypothetical protein